MITTTNLRKLFLLAFLIGSFTGLKAQSDTAGVRQKVEAKEYTFIAQDAIPMSGRTVQLTSFLYNIRISGDSLIVALPYYGQVYTSPTNPGEGGFNFTSTSFNYRVKYRKNKWDISIKPKDIRVVSEMNLTIYSNGRALLQVSSNDRQPISFNGALSYP